MSYWVIDANIAVQTAVNLSDRLEMFWKRAEDRQVTPCSPRLWLSETTSAVRFYLAQKMLNVDEAELALQTIHGLKVEIIDEDESMCLRALELAGLLGQNTAYDAFYLVLAERLDAEFWTADERLANRCRKDLNLAWVHWPGEI
jgi:predicted nucleic acid-binding protein